MIKTYILMGTTAVPEPDLLTWGLWFETADRQVAETWLTPEVRVSTAFLGLDHQCGDGPPLLFETMIIHEGAAMEMWRWSTWTDAEEGHKAAVALARRQTSKETQP